MAKYMIGQWHTIVREQIVEADSLAGAIAKVIGAPDQEGWNPDHLKGISLEEVPNDVINQLEDLQDEADQLLTNLELFILPSIAYWEERPAVEGKAVQS